MRFSRYVRSLGLSGVVSGLVVVACAPLQIPSSGHLARSSQKPPELPAGLAFVRLPALPPKPNLQESPTELLSAVVSDVPVKTFLFALARDSNINIDIDPTITGRVTLNAKNQTLMQILERVVAQAPVRYEVHGRDIRVLADTPYMHHYTVDYVNLRRQLTDDVAITSELGTGSIGGNIMGGNRSTTSIKGTTDNYFWDSLLQNTCMVVTSIHAKNQEEEKDRRDASLREERLNIALSLLRGAQTAHPTAGTTAMTSPRNGDASSNNPVDLTSMGTSRRHISSSPLSHSSVHTTNTADLMHYVLQGSDESSRIGGRTTVQEATSGHSPPMGTAGGTAGISTPSTTMTCTATGTAYGTGRPSSTQPQVFANREAGLLSVYSTEKGHVAVRQFLDQIMSRAKQQVLIEATVVEVLLSRNAQQGINWSYLANPSTGKGFTFQQGPVGTGLLGTQEASLLRLDFRGNSLTSAITALESFGDVRVLSSPKLAVLNNQAATLKVVDNYVYITITFTPGTRTVGANGNMVLTSPDAYTSTINTVPVGLMMTVMPQIAENGQVTLNVRPTITRVIREITDPNPALLNASIPIINKIPVIQSREMESLLRIQSGDIAVLGGLMQDNMSRGTDGLPGLSQVPGIGSLFSQTNDTRNKSELVIFLRPVVVQDPSMRPQGEHLKSFLPDDSFFERPNPLQRGTVAPSVLFPKGSR
jgi:MSHA biogenesis protein MshL